MNVTHTIGAIACLVVASGCATHSPDGAPTVPQDEMVYEHVTNPHFAAIQQAASKSSKDRLAILGMQGEYRVDFDFQETVPLKPDYEIRKDKNTGGFETVFVVENSDTHISLQHVLVTPTGYVVKHWRQDWFFEAAERFEFVEDQTWELIALPVEKTRDAWTQCVYEVSDAPRYCGTGKWNHRYGVSTWTSDRTWRPLPRREYTQRSDYNAMNAENRHTVTAHGWTHEQDNTKTLRDGRKTISTLVREFGFNDYRSIAGFDFSAGDDYWLRTQAYWGRVRAAWQQRMSSGTRLKLNTKVDGMPIIVATFEHAENVEEMSADEQVVAINAVLDEWTVREERVSQR